MLLTTITSIKKIKIKPALVIPYRLVILILLSRKGGTVKWGDLAKVITLVRGRVGT